YQTVYARTPGAVAAPTAGLHFTQALLDRLSAGGVLTADVTLHVGLGTFAPIDVEELSEHRMHREWYEIDATAAETIRSARAGGGRVIAVGTTSARVLESQPDATPAPASGWTDLFIYPPFAFRHLDALVTNFHLPGSTLLALVMAFAGIEQTRAAYAEAIARRYRFYSYGDAMLIV
ncbi:MAG: S-adenosylmethionine:tRNA ribosyltransferase-isomerase, partial [Planctomycetota bacterium]